MFDVIIIGAGPAGLSAAIYAARRIMKTLVISKNVGGQVIWASEIENYPGVKNIKALELIKNMSQQVKDLGVEIKTSAAESIKKNSDGSFQVEAGGNSYAAKSLIIALGLAPKQLNLPGENELVGRGISYCANCDGPLFKGKNVAVVGGGNAALDAAEVMAKIAQQVYLIYRKANLKAFEVLIKEVTSQSNVEILTDTNITEIIGKQRLEKIKIINNISQKSRELEVDGLFIEIGHAPQTEIVASLVERDAKAQIIVDLNAQTSQPGVFAAGDVTQNEFKQIIVSCGQGAVAALSAYKYLQTKK